MKKLIVASILGLTAVPAMAQSQASIYGAVNEYITTNRTNGNTTTNMVNDISHIGVRASENIGSGLTARVVVETGVLVNNPVAAGNATQFGDRQSTVGIAGRGYSFDFGRSVHSTFTTLGSLDPFGNLIGSLSGDVHNLRNLRISNGVFITAQPVTGLTLAFDRGMEVAGTPGNPTSAAASWSFRGVNLQAARFENTAASARSNIVGATAPLGAGRQVYASLSQNTDGNVTRRGALVGATQKISNQVMLKASYGRTDSTTDVSAYNVGAAYSFSRRTLVEAVYRRVDLAGTQRDVNAVSFGLRHSF